MKAGADILENNLSDFNFNVSRQILINNDETIYINI
jgi:hypothetical protein